MSIHQNSIAVFQESIRETHQMHSPAYNRMNTFFGLCVRGSYLLTSHFTLTLNSEKCIIAKKNVCLTNQSWTETFSIKLND